MRPYSPERVYTLEDLNDWDFPGASLAVLGYPVTHSISPQMHNAALQKLSEKKPGFSDWRYFKFEVPPEELIASLPKFHEKGFRGINLTVPHKEIVLDAIETKDEFVNCTGSINTLKRTASSYEGFNTDGFGLLEGIRRDLGSEIKGRTIYLLGAGGAARAAAATCIERGCSSLHIVNRNQERLNRLILDMQPLAKDASLPLNGYSPEDPIFSIPNDSLVINATSLGLKTDDPLPVREDSLQSKVALYDMIYNPPETRLMQHVRKLGGKYANGLSMLVYQGAKSLEIWTGTEVPTSVMMESATKEMAIRV